MSFRAAILFAATFAATPLALTAQQFVDPSVTREEILLQRIRVVAAEMMLHLPDYTCTQTIERSRRTARNKKYEMVDSLRLEVALAGNRELFAWPGATRFEERDIMDIVGGGAIGTGDFALHAKNVLLSQSAEVTLKGEELLGDRRVYRFDFVVPRTKSAYLLRVPPESGMVGYRGAYWIDTSSLELVKLVIDVDDIPSNIPLRNARNEIAYQRVHIGGGEFLLPAETQLVLEGADGSSSRNRTSFANCRKYSGESTLTFDDPPDASGPEGVKAIELPAGLSLNLRLESTLDVGAAARGDQLRFVATKDATQAGRVWVPKGAEVNGRLIQKHCWSETRRFCFLNVRLERFRHHKTEGSVSAILEWPDAVTSLESLPAPLRGDLRRLPPEVRSLLKSGEAVVIQGGSRPKWQAGSATTWRTRAAVKPSDD